MERNKRTTIPVASSTSQKAVSKLTSVNMLDSFFPFDPYFLRRYSVPQRIWYSVFVQCTRYSVPGTVYLVQCTWYSVQYQGTAPASVCLANIVVAVCRSSKFIKPFYREWEGVDAEEEYDDAEGSDVEVGWDRLERFFEITIILGVLWLVKKTLFSPWCEGKDNLENRGGHG